MRPAGGGKPFAVRFETPPGQQAQVDFAQFQVRFATAPDGVQVVWLFSMVLGFSRLISGRFILRKPMPSVLACHHAAFEAIGSVPREIFYDRMKTAVIGEDEDGRVVYNRTLGEFAKHYGYRPKACRAYRPETKGKVERPFRSIREDFFLGGVFHDLDDPNAQFNRRLSTVANPRLHATTGRIVNEAFAEEMPALQPLPRVPFGAVLKLERRISHEGMVSVGGNYYSVPDSTRRRVVEVHSLVDEIRIFENDRLIGRPPLLEGQRQRPLLTTVPAAVFSTIQSAAASNASRTTLREISGACAPESGCCSRQAPEPGSGARPCRFPLLPVWRRYRSESGSGPAAAHGAQDGAILRRNDATPSSSTMQQGGQRGPLALPRAVPRGQSQGAGSNTALR